MPRAAAARRPSGGKRCWMRRSRASCRGCVRRRCSAWPEPPLRSATSGNLGWATDALTEAERSRDPATQAAAWIHLAGLAGRAGAADTLAFRIERAQRLLDDENVPPRLEANLLTQMGEEYQSAGMYVESAKVLREAREMFDEHAPDSASLPLLISSQAQAELFTGRGGTALQLATEALEAFQRSRGAENPYGSMLLIERATAHGALQDNAAAAKDLRAAIALLQANPEFRPDLLIVAHDRLAEALLNDQEYDRALRESDRALELAEVLFADQPANRALFLWTRAAILFEQEAFDRALRTIDDALDALGDGKPDKETSVVALLLLRAETLVRLDRKDEGRLALQVATDASRAAFDRQTPSGLQHTEVIARTLGALGDTEAARKELQRGLDDARAVGDDARVETLQAVLREL